MENWKKYRKYVFGIVGIGIVLCFVYILVGKKNTASVVENNIPECRMEYNIPVDSFYMEESAVQKNETLSDILQTLGATSADMANIHTLNSTTFDTRTMHSGNKYKAFFSLGSDTNRRLCYWVYEKSATDYSVFCFLDTFCIYHGKKEIKKQLTLARAKITSSLWNAMLNKGITPNLAMDLSDIYAWSIDFFGLQKGDHFTVLYDELYLDTTFVGIGDIHAAEFYNNGKNYYAFCFEQDSTADYWDEEGNSLRKAFLKAPLKFSRISSHFSHARRHPVLRIIRPHTGVDYAAPSGTPVMTIGSGTVIEKGYKIGGGNTVKIRHNATYSTAYLHLSKFAKDLKKGSYVAQGQVIGYVGSTGLSTGPHLDFRVWKNGKPVNPLTIESPPSEPVKQENKTRFDSVSNTMKMILSLPLKKSPDEKFLKIIG